MSNNFSRRTMLQGTAAAGVLAASGVPAVAMPKRGGKLRLGLKGANTSDTWDGRTHSDSFMINMGHGCVFECLTEVLSNGELAGELAESWSASADAKVWTFKLRKGVKFHNGKSFGADDVIESLKMHTAEGAKSAAKPIVSAITDMQKVNNHEVKMTLKTGNADFPYLLSDYHIMIYPAGMIEEAIANGIGTGPYSVVSFNPGVRAVVKRVDDHHLADRGGYFDEIEAIAINDDAARTNALLTGQVDAINNMDKKTIPLAKANPMVKIVEVTGNMQYTFPMLVGVEPFGDINVRKALKYACDREEMVSKILQGHGAIGNDNPIGPANQYVNNDLEQLAYDPDKSKHYLKKAGMSSLNIDLSASDGAFGGAVVGPYAPEGKSGVGHLVIAINITAVRPLADFEADMEQMISDLKSAPKQSGIDEIFYPGEIEARSDKTLRASGITIPADTLAELREQAEKIGIKAPF